MATVLYLFSDAEMMGNAPVVPNPQVEPHRAYIDPCKACPMAGLCDSDECGMKGFPIDSPFPSTRFPNLGAYIDFLKHYGWL